MNKTKEEQQEIVDKAKIAGKLINEALMFSNVETGIALYALQAVYLYTMRQVGESYERYCESLKLIMRDHKRLWDEDE